MQRSITSLILTCGLLHATAAASHEFWIEAQSASAAGIRVGQMLVGENLPYLDRIIRSARHFGPDGNDTLKGRQGDLPALSVNLTSPGLHVITVETEPAYIVFDDLTEFGEYLSYEGLQAILDQHQALGLPATEIAEEYLRYARSLVQVGPISAEDADAAVGLRYELIAESSPFGAQNGQVDLQLMWEGTAEAGAQIAQFHKGTSDQAAVTRQLLRSDADGKVSANVGEAGLYVFSAVHMLAADGPGSVMWQSHWASLSFTLGNKAIAD